MNLATVVFPEPIPPVKPMILGADKGSVLLSEFLNVIPP
jgi:hypothetical protein